MRMRISSSANAMPSDGSPGRPSRPGRSRSMQPARWAAAPQPRSSPAFSSLPLALFLASCRADGSFTPQRSYDEAKAAERHCAPTSASRAHAPKPSAFRGRPADTVCVAIGASVILAPVGKTVRIEGTAGTEVLDAPTVTVTVACEILTPVSERGLDGKRDCDLKRRSMTYRRTNDA